MPASPATPLRVHTARHSKSPSPKAHIVRSPRNATETGLAVLKKDLSRFTRTNDRVMVIRTLQSCLLLNSIPLDATPLSPQSPDQWKRLEREVCSNPLNLNGHNFVVHNLPNIHTMRVLTELCRQLCSGVHMAPETLYKALVVRLAKTTSAADCYFHLTAALGSPDLVIQPPSKPFDVPPSEIVIYQADGYIHASLSVYHPYGLFRKTDVSSGKPWIKVIAAAHERVNLTTGASTRHAALKVYPSEN
jgi:hypothetical protein